MAPQQRTAIAAAGVWTLAFLLPAPSFLMFDGLAWSSIGEVVVLLVALVALASGRCRSVVAATARRVAFRTVVAVVILGVAVAVIKLVLLASAPAGGFRACYSNPIAPRPGGGCELSFDNLFSRDDATRFDEVIDFGPRTPPDGDPRLITGSDWNLSFVNELRLNSVSTGRGELNVERLPFSANWRGEIEVGARGWIPIRYVGEGRVQIDGHVTVLQPSYRSARTEFVRVRAGVHDLRIAFRFADQQTVTTEPRGRYATLRVGDVRPDRTTDSADLLRTTPPAFGWQLLATLVDASFMVIALALAGALAFAHRASWRHLLAAGLLGVVAWVLTGQHGGFAAASVSIAPTVIAFVVVVVVLLYRRVEDLILIGGLGAVALAVERVLGLVPDLQSVLFRPRGQDSLSYEWFARQILESGSLEAGEKVFYYQPGFRYWVFGGHGVFGDSDALPAAFGLALVIAAVVVATRWSVGRAREGRAAPGAGACLVIAIACSALIVAVTSEPVYSLIVGGASEYPTWFLIPVVSVLLFGRPTLPRWILGSAGLAATVVFRPNQGIAALFLMAVFVIWQLRRDRRRTLLCVGIFFGILLLPALHNIVYGGQLELLPTGASSVEDLRPDRLFDLFSDRSVGALLRDKLAALLYLTPREHLDPALGTAILAIQVTWIACVVRAVRRRRIMPWHAWCILAWPLTYAIPFISYDVYIYYPRHIMAVYVAAAASVIFVEARYLAAAHDRPDAPAVGQSGARLGLH